ncbi:MAG: class II aldolase/adducin family protein, partial [SAR202 cluster bacterium]|nr:class II aldolase/adducin family protein [SAR202 cluster bacterium]
MDSRWSESEARSIVDQSAEAGLSPDMALRVYSTRLLGQDSQLVLHGGGNTSMKTTATDVLGDEVDVLCVKGSGWDMGVIEAAGLPAVRLDPLRRLSALDELSDEDMVNFLRTNLLDSSAPNPSVETLLHAFLPHKFVDHTHANAILSLTDQPDGESICRDLYGDQMGIVPYIMPGFDLAREAAQVFEAQPDVEGLIALKHGIFTFAETAREAYERMIEMVSRAEERLSNGRKSVFSQSALPASTIA